MTYNLNWQVPGQVLQLDLAGEYTLSEAREVNDQLLSHLNSSDEALTLIIDAVRMQRPYNFSAIRATQTFMDHQKIAHIYVIVDDHLVKLSMMVIFNLSRARLHFKENAEQAIKTVERQLGIHK